MTIALCMVVKDEIHRIEACLDPIHRLVDEIVIIDTGSTDGTPELIRRKFGIEVMHGLMEECRCLTKIDMRNLAFSHVTADWILSIDADERMHPEGLRELATMRHDPEVSGYFGLWRNHMAGAPAFDDYKCFAFRRGTRMRGLVHENAQSDIRSRGGRAVWLDALRVEHHPEMRKHELKTHLYHRRLMCALALEPDWHRYYWFLGYMQYQAGEWDEAMANFRLAFDSDSTLFPVERLNSAMVWAEILCALDRVDEATALLQRARALWDTVQDDFEVKINTRMRPWLDHAVALVGAGHHRDVRAYRFAR